MPYDLRRDSIHQATRSLMLAFAMGLSCVSACGQQWQQSFEQGLEGARPYHAEAPRTKLEVASGGAADGENFLRATLPGQRLLEGCNITATGLTGARLATVTAQVRGKGELWLCLISSNGWLYAPVTVPLTDNWQEISLSKALKAGDTTLGIHFITKTVQPGAVFEVDDVRVFLAAPPRTYDAEVGPWRLEAEDFAARQTYVGEDRSASGGQVAAHGKYVPLTGLPFPRTSRPVTVYLRVKPQSGHDQFRLVTRQGGHHQSLSIIEPKAVGEWQWLSFPPAFAGEVGDTFEVEFFRKAAAVEVKPTAMDAVVISTLAELDGAVLDGAPPLLSPAPLALVSRCAIPPKLDGQGDDACWQQTIACTDFPVVRSLAVARAATVARLCYDDDNLYLLFVCEEPILDVAAQRRHEFRATVQERDGDVYNDDSCVIILGPDEQAAEFYDFFVNALGTVEDARCTVPNLWEGRDTGWNSMATAAGDVGDGAWTVEMAIPFASLSGGTPAVGDSWQACLGRIARARKETSSWNPSDRGFHVPARWGALVFAGDTPGVVLNEPLSLHLGKNPLTAMLTPRAGQPGGVYLISSVRSSTGVRYSYEFADLSGEPVRAEHEFQIADEGEVQIAHGVLDAATLALLYLTPSLPRAVRSTTATVRLACDGPYELLLNGDMLASGQSADAAEISAPLQRGANVFVLRLEQGTAAVRIEAPGSGPVTVNWKVSPDDVEDSAAVTTDDSSWETAQQVRDHPTLGAVIGVPGQKTMLRHTLLWEKTRSWPTPRPALYVARNSNQHLTFIADGLPGRSLIDWTVYLALPLEFEFLGATGYYGNVEYQPHYTSVSLGQQTVAGREMHVTKIAATEKPVMAGHHYIMSLFNALVRYREQAGEPEHRETSFIYWTEANDRTVVEPPQVIPVRVLPPLNGRQPKKLTWQLWGSFFSNIEDTGVREAFLQTMQAAGINDLVSGDRWTSDNAPRYGIEHTLGVNFASWSMGMGPYLEAHPDQRLIDKDGQPDDSHLCMTLLLGDSWSAVAAKLKEKIDTVAPHTVDYDYEHGPFGPPHACYCPRCLSAFRDHAKLPADARLTPETIEGECDDEWVDFMAWRVAQMFRNLKDEIHRLAPGTKFSVYSGYQSPQNPRQYGVDWRYVGQLQACDQIGCGYGRPVDSILATTEAVQGIPAIFGALFTPYNTTDTVPPVPMTRARLLVRSLDATGGVLVYDRQPLDGRSWLAIAETTRLVAAYEGLFINGEKTALPGLDGSQVQVVSDGNVTLVCAMNGSSKEATYTLLLPAGAGAGQEFYSGRKVVEGETVQCVLPPGETAVYVLEK